ncbi:hypothetical protein ACGFWE_10250 [Streptomyces sp. NPDC048523]|uniref:hypothetical protein n=1 Tax=Streptomyces sp. NPDC048523 TaxID=3365567 RepID=UPI003712EC5C
MNTERPDNNDPGETSDAGDESAAEARGAGGASGTEAQGGGEASGAAEERGSEAPGDEGTSGAEAGRGGGTEGTENAGAAAADTPEDEDAEGVADSDSDDSPGSDTEATAAAAVATEPEGSVGARSSLGTGADPDVTGAASPAARPDSEIPRDGDAGVPRVARHRSPVAIAAVAAAVLLVGGGGAYLAAGTAGGSGGGAASGAAGDGTPPPLALDGYGAGGETGNGIAPGEPNPYGVTYRVDGSLPQGPGSAPVYRVQGQVTEDDVTRLAEALGVDGKPVAQGQLWRIGVKDGSGPSLQVNRQAPGAWTFQRYSPVIDDCRSATVCGAPTGRPVSEAVAEKAAAPVLKAVGQGTAKLDASQVMGAQRTVNADPVVGGLPTYGWATGVTVNGQGEVVGGTGQLKAPVKSDTYPVLSAEKTLGLLNKVPVSGHRMGIGGCASPVPLKDRLEAPCGESTASPANNTLSVEKAVFGLASHFVGGRQALVPSWLFEVRAPGAKDAFTVTYPAVDPAYITSPATATPTTPVSPTAPSDRPTSAPKTRDVQVDGYTAEGNELTVSFTGGVCGDYTASAGESADEVKVTVTYTPWPDKVCIMIAKEIQKTVPLDEPLGARKVVGSDGKEIPLKKAGARLPETSGAAR